MTYIDDVLADAEGDADHSPRLSADCAAWRDALIELLADTRAALAGINAELTRLPGMRQGGRTHPKRAELTQERALYVDRQSRLEVRLRLVKSMMPSTPSAATVRARPDVSDRGAALLEAQRLLRDAARILGALVADDPSCHAAADGKATG